MKPSRFDRGFSFPRFLSALLTAAFCLQATVPAHALRQPSAIEADPQTLSGLEESLSSGSVSGNSSHTAVSSVGNALEQLRQAREKLSDLSPRIVSTVRIWAELDFLLGVSVAEDLPSDSKARYLERQRLLSQIFPVRSDLILQTLTAGEGGLFTFQLRVLQDVYVLSVRTERPLDTESYVEPKAALSDLPLGTAFFLEEITTGVIYPWEIDLPYPASYLAGQSDRFGNPLQEIGGAWSVKPGFQKGDVQFFKLVSADTLHSPWETTIGELVPGVSPSGTPRFTRTVGNQSHLFIKDSSVQVAADVISGTHKTGSGATLTVAFPSGNSGFAFRDTSAPAPYQLADVRAVTRGTQGQRGVAFRVQSSVATVSIDGRDLVLDTVRRIRDWANPYDEGRFRATMLQNFSDAVHLLPPEVHAELRSEGISLYEMLLRSHPVIRHRHEITGHRLYILRRSIGGRLYIVEMVFPPNYKVEVQRGNIHVHSGGQPAVWDMAVTTDFPPLHEIPESNLLKSEALATAAESPAFQARLMEVSFSAFKEFFIAGAHRFLQYFSRDTLIWLRLSAPMLKAEAHGDALQTVLDRISAEGRLPASEETGDQVAFELIEQFCLECRRASGNFNGVKEIARHLHSMPAERLEYGPPDVDFMLLPALAEFLERKDLSPEMKHQFLLQSGRSGVRNITAILRNVTWVSRQARELPTAVRAHQPHHLAFVPGVPAGGSPDAYIGNWRDTTYGLGYGKYPADVNAHLIPAALRAIPRVIHEIEAIPLDSNVRAEIDRVLQQQGSTQDLRALASLWGETGRRTLFSLSPREIRDRLRRYLYGGAVGGYEQRWLLERETGSGLTLEDFLRDEGPIPAVLRSGVGEGLSYFPVALDQNGQPVPVISSDAVFALLEGDLAPAELINILTPLLLPYPLGLWTPAGFLVASPVLSDNGRLWSELSKNAYGGSVIYGWQMEYLKMGLIRQILHWENQPTDQVDREWISLLYSVLETCCRITGTVEAGQELWTWNVDAEGFHRVSFGAQQGHNEETNPVQLWSISASEMLLPRVRQMAQGLNLEILPSERWPDAVAQLRDRYALSLDRESQTILTDLPRVAIVHYFLPPSGGGTNTVIWDQGTMLRAAGYQVKFLGGRVYSGTKGERIYSQMGFGLQIIPELDMDQDLMDQARRGIMDAVSVRRRVEALKTTLREAFKDIDVVLVHQIMGIPLNLVATAAFSELAREYRGQKRFIAWVHNIDESTRDTSWPMYLNAVFQPDLEYVTVSPPLRESVASVLGISSHLIGAVNNSVGAQNFLLIHPRVLQFYFRHQLNDAEAIWFYPSRMERSKLIEAAIWAVYEANEYQGMDVRLVIATPAAQDGGLPTQGAEGDYVRYLMELRDGLILSSGQRMSDKVVFYPHQPESDSSYPQWEIGNWYELSDALMFTSQTETFGIPVREAVMKGRIVFRTDLSELNRLRGGIQHTFPPIHWGDSVELYGKRIGHEAVRVLREEAADYMRVQAGRRLSLGQSSEINLQVLAPLLNLPPSSAWQARRSNRNFPVDSDRTEDAVRESSESGFNSFEVNFEGFKPTDIDPAGRQRIREAARNGGKEVRLNVRLTDFPVWKDKSPVEILREATQFARDTGSKNVTVRLPYLDLTMAQAIIQASQEVSAEGISFSVENALAVKGRWTVLLPRQLNQFFEGTLVGVSVWLDPLTDPTGYVEQLKQPVAALYVGGSFWGPLAMEQSEKAEALLRSLNARRWQGELVVQIPLDSIWHLATRSGARRALLDDLIRSSYLPPETVHSLRTGEMPSSPPADLFGGFTRTVRNSGLEETLSEIIPGVRRTADLHQPVAVLFDPQLVPGGSDAERQVNLIGLAGSLRAAFAWPEDVSLELGLLSERGGLEERGYRIIEVVPHPESAAGALPQAALPVVVAEALAATGNRFLVNVSSYAGLEEVTLPEILNVLTDRFA